MGLLSTPPMTWVSGATASRRSNKLQTTQLKDVLPEEIGSQLPEMAVPEEVTNTLAAVGNVKKVREEIFDKDYNFDIAEYLELL